VSSPPPVDQPASDDLSLVLARNRVGFGVGLAGGAVGALLGGGTGVITVPALDRLTELRRAVIHGTANLVNVAVAVVGATIYGLRGGHLDGRVAIGLMAGGVLGASFGARIAAKASDRSLRVAFCVVLTVGGVELCLGAAGFGPTSGSPLLSHGLRTYLAAVFVLTLAIGLVVGTWSAAMGLGGGSLTVPVVILLFGLDAHAAEGTSLLVMLPNSIAASVQHLRQGTANPDLAVSLSLGAVPGAVAGALIGLVLPATALDWVFGLFVLFIAAQQFRRVSAGTLTTVSQLFLIPIRPAESCRGRRSSRRVSLLTTPTGAASATLQTSGHRGRWLRRRESPSGRWRWRRGM
jgi:uncharacterized protein